MMMKHLETKRILIFIGITFLLTYVYIMGAVYPMMNESSLFGVPDVKIQLMVAAVMFVPSIGVLLTRLLTKEGLKNAWVRPNLKGNVKIYLFAYFGPGVLTLIGSLIYFLIFPGNFDPECGYLLSIMESAGVSGDTIPMPPPILMMLQFLSGLFTAPILNFVTCFGEEWGWRGYLLPKMSEKMSGLPLLLVTGVIWGLWHVPLTAVGHNYGVGYWGFPFTGIFAMCVFCIVIGIFLSYVTMKTKSCIPAVLTHGAINGTAAIGIYFTKDGGNPFVGPAPMGIIGGIPFIVVGIVLVKKYFVKKR